MATVMGDLKALWVGIKSFTESAGTFGTDRITNGVVKSFVTAPDTSGLADAVRPITFGRMTVDNDKALDDVLIDLPLVMTRVLQSLGYDPTAYENDSNWGPDTTFFDLQMHLIALYAPDVFASPADVPDTHIIS